jgi:hypothetical protein
VQERSRAATGGRHDVSGFGLRQGGGTRNRARMPIPHCGQSLGLSLVRGATVGHKPKNGSCQPVPGMNCGCPSVLPLRKT